MLKIVKVKKNLIDGRTKPKNMECLFQISLCIPESFNTNILHQFFATK